MSEEDEGFISLKIHALCSLFDFVNIFNTSKIFVFLFFFWVFSAPMTIPSKTNHPIFPVSSCFPITFSIRDSTYLFTTSFYLSRGCLRSLFPPDSLTLLCAIVDFDYTKHVHPTVIFYSRLYLVCLVS